MSVKIVHEYTNHDGDKIKEQLEFSLTRTELAENMHLVTEFEEMDAIAKEDPRQLKPEETRKMFLLIKELMKLAYGVRGEKGGRIVHIKTEEVWESFVESKLYDSFIFYLFANTKRANDFMEALMPSELREAAAQLAGQQSDGNPAPIAPSETGGQKSKRQPPTQEELLALWKEKEEQRSGEVG